MSYKAYPTYKDSGVEWLGEIPEDWDITPLKHLAFLENGRDYKDIQVEYGGYPVIGSGGEFARASRFMYDGESILLGRKGTIDKPIYLKTAFWSVDTMYYTVIKKSAFPKYLYYCALTIPFNKYTTNTALPSMTQEDLGSISFSVPNFTDQTKIATFLDRETGFINEMIEKKSRFIELLKEKRQALITHAVTKGINPDVKMKDSGVEWLGEGPEHWDIVKAKYLFTIEKRIAGILGHDVLSITQTGIKVKDIESGEGQLSMDYTKYQIVKVGDFAMNHMDLLTGYVDISQFDGVTSPDYRVFRLSAKNCHPQYYLYHMQRGYKERIFFNYGHGSAQLGRWRLPTDEFKELSFPVPPYDEQQAIAEYIERETTLIDSLISKTNESISLLKEKRSAQITAAVTGKIDVREEA